MSGSAGGLNERLSRGRDLLASTCAARCLAATFGGMASFKAPKFEGLNRFEKSGRPGEYCEVEVLREADAPRDTCWVTQVRGGIIGESPSKRWRKKTNNGFSARHRANLYITKLIAQGYQPVKLPRKKVIAEPKRVLSERGIPLIDDYIARVSRTSPRRPRAGDPARLAKVRLAGRQRLPPTLARYLAYDLTLARVPHKGRRPLFLDSEGYEPAPVDLETEALQLLRARHGRAIGSRQLVDLDSGRKLRSARDAFDTRLKGKLYRLPAIGEQRHYLYAGRADSAGELPVVAFELDFDPRPSGELAVCIAVFLKYPSFDLLLLDLTGELDVRLKHSAERRAFGKLMQDARRRHPELRDQARY